MKKCLVMCMFLAACMAVADGELELRAKTRTITVTEGRTAKWVVDVVGHPDVRFMTWLSPAHRTISGSKYSFKWNATRAVLQIRDVSVNDRGTYRVVARNPTKQETLDLVLIVKAKASVSFKQLPELYYFPDNSYNFTCVVTGLETPKINWYFEKCNETDCSSDRNPVSDSNVIEEGKVNESYFSTLQWTAVDSESGYLTCEAVSGENSVENRQHIWVVNLDQLSGLYIDGKDEATDVIEGDNITLACAVPKFNVKDVQWYLGSTGASISDLDLPNVGLKDDTTSIVYRLNLTITNVTRGNSDVYHCRSRSSFEVHEDNVTINVQATESPRIHMPAEDSSQSVGPRDHVEWTCNATGIPPPQFRWFKDEGEIDESLIVDNTSLVIKFPTVKNEGKYTCEAWNRAGSERRSLTIAFIEKAHSNVPLTVTITLVVLTVVVVILVSVVAVNQRNAKIRRNELHLAGLANFEEGAIESLNPLLPISSQADLLPYDRKWEFPREQLKLGQQLGSGAFGIVMKAEALGIRKDEAVTTVAVKMVRRNADIAHVRNLGAELKIMAHLGKHLNIVNLLGACTKNLTVRELLVIVEYCRHGNLHNYLLRHRSNFVDEVNPKTRELDPISAQPAAPQARLQLEENSGMMAGGALGANSSGEAYIEMHPKKCDADCTSGVNQRYASMGPAHDQAKWRCQHTAYDKEDVRPVCTRDLTCWAFQVARGMEYLAARKILHGDLATRNILLADDNVVKICDFGLSKQIYSENYQKKGDGLMPVKWMAIESLRDRVFSTQSDVWSFGIVLWEIFTLSRTPYPEMDIDENILKKLIAGYRMDEPEYAPKAVNEIMQRCWLAQPNDRPTFTKIVDHLCRIIEKDVQSHYIELNDSYQKWNTDVMLEGHSDYLMMMSAPTYDNLLAPANQETGQNQYVNSNVFTPKTRQQPQQQAAPPTESNTSAYTAMTSLETHM